MIEFHFFARSCPDLPTPFVEEAIFAPFYAPTFFVKYFTYFSCLIPLVRTSSTSLNRSGECKDPCLLSDLKGKAFSFSPLNMMFAVGL